MHRALAHQLERHDGRGLLQDQAFEITQAVGVARREQPGARSPAPARVHGHDHGAAGDPGEVGNELGRVECVALVGAMAIANTLRNRLDGSVRQLAPEHPGGERLAVSVHHDHGATKGGGQRSDELVQPPLLDHQPLQPLVDADAALEHLVLLVDEPRKRLLGDGDEREVVGNLEHREVDTASLVE